MFPMVNPLVQTFSGPFSFILVFQWSLVSTIEDSDLWNMKVDIELPEEVQIF